MREKVLTIQIYAPRRVVFEYTTNPNHTPKWISFIEAEEAEQFPPIIGTRYKNKSSDSGGWSEYAVVDYIEDELFVLKNLANTYHVSYRYTKTDDGTNLTYHEWVEEGELSDPFEEAHLVRLKTILEQQSAHAI